ncbi:MAG: hypothetical protein KJP23_25690 [Deltaproteobacteria bacterium]|nr:hypothetical protein [Deltaproteobacteria bacterium]
MVRLERLRLADEVPMMIFCPATDIPESLGIR